MSEIQNGIFSTKFTNFKVKKSCGEKINRIFGPTTKSNNFISYEPNINLNSMIDRYILQTCEYVLKIECNAIPKGNYYFNKLNLVQFPLNSILSTTYVSCNKTTCSSETSRIFPVLKKIISEECKIFNGAGDFSKITGISKNENVQENVFESFESIDDNEEPIFYVRIKTSEPVVSDFNTFDYNNEINVIYGVCNLSLKFSFDQNNVSNCLEIEPKENLKFDSNKLNNGIKLFSILESFIEVSFINQPVSEEINKLQSLKYNSYVKDVTENLKEESLIVYLNSVPKNIICYLSDSDNNIYPIEKCELSFNDQKKNYDSKKNLFQMSVRNGLKMTFKEWEKENIIIFDANEFNLEMYNCEGTLGCYRCQISLKWNLEINKVLKLNIITVDPCLIITDKGFTSIYKGLITQDDVLKSYGSDIVENKKKEKNVKNIKVSKK